MKKINLNKFCKLSLILLAFYLLPIVTEAAVYTFDSIGEISQKEEFKVIISIDTENETINSVSGKLIIPKGLDVKSINDGKSSITLWIERPNLDTQTYSIIFSGIVPGGIQGVGEVFSIILSGQEEGNYTLSISEPLVLLNDGEGTAANSKSRIQNIKISENVNESSILLEDTTPPEDFMPIVTTSSEDFEGQSFVSFATSDKDSGIDRYEYSTSHLFKPKSSSYSATESPLILTSEEESRRIYIKAIDRAGNERVVHVAGSKYHTAIFVSVIILIFLCALYFLRPFYFKRFFSRS